MGIAAFLGRARHVGGRVIGQVGNVLKKVGDTAAPVVRKVAAMAGPVSTAVTGIGAALGQPEIMAAGGLMHKGAQWLASGKADALAQKVSSVGGRMQAVGNAIQGGA